MKSKGRIIPASYYLSIDVAHLAKDLLGKILCTRIDDLYCSGMIVETEAYRGPDDRAAHSFNNRRTPRTEVMFGKGGVSYIYICYGMHHLMNVITGPKDHPHAVLIRALHPIDGVDIMAKRRQLDISDYRLTKGPGALSVAMGLRSIMTGTPVYDSKSSIWMEDRGIKIKEDEICVGQRIGVEGAGEAAHWPWRFFVKGDPYVSAKRTC